MQRKRILAVTAATLMLAATLTATTASSSEAFHSDPNKSYVYLPNTNIKLTANAWSQSIISGGNFNWTTSSTTTVNGANKRVQSIKNTATVEVIGINVTVSAGGVSGGAGVTSSSTLKWTNTNAWISDLGGRAGYTGILVKAHVNSSAFAVHAGVKNSVSAWSW